MKQWVHFLRTHMRHLTCVLFFCQLFMVHADWPTVRGNVQRTGFIRQTVELPIRLEWARSFQGERLGTAMEAIVSAGKVFVATHSGNLYALE